MPTSESSPSSELQAKILPFVLDQAGEMGWTDKAYSEALLAGDISEAEAALAFPSGPPSLVSTYFATSLEKISQTLSEAPLDDMRIRDKVTLGVSSWLDLLSEHKSASIKALDWIAIRPTGPLPATELVWSLADTIWTGIGDEATGFTYMTKRTTLSGVISSTLLIWRTSEREDWLAFLDRRIENVMTFEKFKAKVKLPF